MPAKPIGLTEVNTVLVYVCLFVVEAAVTAPYASSCLFAYALFLHSVSF